MNTIDKLIEELCPDGVEYVPIKLLARRNPGMSITASQMKEIHFSGGPIRIFAGGSTIADVNWSDVPSRSIVTEPSVIVKSRGHIGFAYHDGPFSHKSELWSYTFDQQVVDTKFAFYYLLKQTRLFQRQANATSVKLPQLSVGDTDTFPIPLPPLEIQREIVKILDTFSQLEAELEAELEARRLQYRHYRDELLSFGDEVEWRTLGEVISSIRTGLNPRSNFVLNSENASNHYITVRELAGMTIVISEKTDKVDDDGLVLINNRSKLMTGDVLFSGTGTIGRTAIVNEQPRDWGIKEGVYALTPNSDCVDNRFMVYYFHSTHFKILVETRTFGSTVQSISMGDLVRMPIPIPPLAEQQRIVDILDTFDALVNDLSSGLPAEIAARRQQYEHYRDRLLTFKEKGRGLPAV